MNYGVVGYRHYNHYESFSSVLADILLPGCTIISGDCIGTDTMAERFADEHKLDKIIFNPDPKLGAGRFHARNRQIVNKCDVLIAFLHKGSKGTKYTIDYARQKNKKVYIIEVNIADC